MRLLEAWIASPVAQAVGWTLLDSLWQGAIIAAGLAAALAAMRSPRARYAAAWMAMLVMLGSIAFTLVRLMPGQIPGIRGLPAVPLAAWDVRSGAGSTGPSTAGLAAIVPWLAPFWFVGVWIFALSQVAGWVSISRLRRRGVCCATERWQKELVRLSAQLRVTRPVTLLESCLAEVPMVVGYIRPVILMPIGLLAGLPSGQTEAILLHELAHIRRHDYLVNLLQRVAESLLFYHPAVWWISRVIRTERENCCDDLAVAATGNAQEYAIALATLEQNRWSGRVPALAITGGSLVKRIRRLLYPKDANGLWTPLFAAAVLIATAIVALAARPSALPRQSPASPQAESGPAETSAYERWLNEEVVYIITDEERAAFEQLTTDEQRDEFVKQFWERRNLNPGSPVNEFKQEFYRRIAYANKHFAASKPGWKTDRGHMYIIYGPPSEIDFHPGNKPYAFEVWTYQHLEGVGDGISFTFVDQSGKGDFDLATAPWKWPALHLPPQ
jgi:GWxTD domain-containing protein